MNSQRNVVEKDISALNKYARLARNTNDEFYEACVEGLVDSINSNKCEIDEERGIRKQGKSSQTKLIT